MKDRKNYKREWNRRRQEEMRPAYDALLSCYPFEIEDLDGEEWKPAVGFEGYAVSNFGRVKSFRGEEPRILTPQLQNGYLGVHIKIDGEHKKNYIHILISKAFIPNPDNKSQVNHVDGHKMNCTVSNLVWSTSSENQQHAMRTGLNKSGIDRPDAKFKDEETVCYVRENPDNLTIKQLAQKFGTHEKTIRRVQRGKTYANVDVSIREPKVKRISDEIREQIRADWATGLYTKATLARKYGCGETTIRKIIRED